MKAIIKNQPFDVHPGAIVQLSIRLRPDDDGDRTFEAALVPTRPNVAHATRGTAQAHADEKGAASWGFLVTLVGYAAIVIAAFILFLTRHRDAANLVSFAGPAVWTFGLLAWVVFFDSRSRWPEASAPQRLLNVITFRRD